MSFFLGGGGWYAIEGVDILLCNVVFLLILNKCLGMITDLYIDKFKFKVRIVFFQKKTSAFI